MLFATGFVSSADVCSVVVDVAIVVDLINGGGGGVYSRASGVEVRVCDRLIRFVGGKSFLSDGVEGVVGDLWARGSCTPRDGRDSEILRVL